MLSALPKILRVFLAFLCFGASPLWAADMPSFNYADNDPVSYRQAKSAFSDEYQQVVDYLNKTEPGNGWGYSDILNLWDYRESLRTQAKNPAADPDNVFTIARQVKANLAKSADALKRDMVANPEYYQIKLLMMIGKPHSEFNMFNPVADVAEKAGMDSLKQVINTLKSSGQAVELAEKEFAQSAKTYKSIEEQKREQAVRAALRKVQFKEARARKLINTRKMMYAKGLLPASPYPDYPPFMDLDCCRYWAVNEGGRYHITGYYKTPSGKKVDYTSRTIRNFAPLVPHAGLFALKSGMGYHVYATMKGGDKSVPINYVIVQLGEEPKVLHDLWVYRFGAQDLAPDYSSLTISYQTEKDGGMHSLTLK